MKARIEIYKSRGCRIVVTGIEDREELYSPEFSTEVGEFSYLDTVTINGLLKVNSKDEETLEEIKIFDHSQEEIDGILYNVTDECTFKLEEDGLYRVIHVILPLKEWIDKFIEAGEEIPYEFIYVWDGIKVLKYEEGEYHNVSYEELFEHLTGEKTEENTNIAHTCQETFSVCRTERCYFNIASKLLHEYCPMHCNLDGVRDLIYKRDLLWMALNVVKYLLEKSAFLEAQRIIEQFLECNDFCRDGLKRKGGADCGCNSKS